MNKFINILFLLLLIPIVALSIFVGFDLPIEILRTSGKNLPHLHTYYLVFAAVFFLLGTRRSMRRWIGVRMVSKQSKFQWNEEIDAKRKSQVNMYLIIEGVLHLLIAVVFISLTSQALVMAIVFIALGLDHLLFCLFGNIFHLWRAGITNKALVVAERDFKILYFSGLRKVSVHQQTLFFDYIKELQLAVSVDCISPENRDSFRATLGEKVNRERVHFTESFKDF